MTEVGIRELKTQASDIIRRVRENNESYIVTYRGRPVAKLEPVQDNDVQLARDLSILEEMDRLAEEITKHWPKGLSAADAVSADRREL
ncbi:MAG: type II toxin-antitoxin system prevent-host-death family antitoxin [Chloroflexi bacterium]|nr:type II toxin-antitoxin system prevent-host-death family antitoxin [Chloroflexota bacterium]